MAALSCQLIVSYWGELHKEGIPDRKPLEVSTHCIHLALVDANATILNEGVLSVIKTTGTVPISII